MNKESALDAIIEDYLYGRLNDDELRAFEALRENNPEMESRIVELRSFLSALVGYGEREALQSSLDHAHATIDTPKLVEQLKPRVPKLVRLWRANKSAISVAASFVLLTLVTFIFNKEQKGSYEIMRRDVQKIKSSQNNLIRDINSSRASVKNNPGRYGGTGFALSSNGYICTNFHVINGADSVYVQNSKGESFKARAVWSDPQNDIAILKISDATFTDLPHLPYSLKTSIVGLGEAVYTLGFPKDDAVLGEGYVSSKSGFGGDTTLAYQVAIAVNPGNSGGPLLDNNGNVIGVISGRESQTDGAAFAIKSKYIMEGLRAIPQDSLNNRIAGVKKKNPLAGLKRTRQIEKIQDYVFMVRVF